MILLDVFFHHDGERVGSHYFIVISAASEAFAPTTGEVEAS
jgi:hypothetical protein